MKRILLMVLRNIFAVPYMWFKLCYYAKHADKYTDEEHNRMLKEITGRANKGGNVTVEGYGIENLPEENGFILFHMDFAPYFLYRSECKAADELGPLHAASSVRLCMEQRQSSKSSAFTPFPIKRPRNSFQNPAAIVSS